MALRHLFRLLAWAGLAFDNRRAGPGGAPLQVAALPVRRSPDGALRVLLITSRTSRRWIIPKGWPVHGLSLAESAAREALEEAGVRGTMASTEIGRFDLLKPGDVAGFSPRTIIVYPMQVTAELADWRERRERRRQWFSLDEAAALIAYADVRPMLRRLERPSEPGSGLPPKQAPLSSP